MANDNGKQKINNYLNILKENFKENISVSSIIEKILDTAREKSCKLVLLEKSYYIQKGEDPLVLFHLNIDNEADITFNISEINNEECIVSENNINIISAGILINYLLMNSDASFDVLLSNSNIQSNLEDYGEIRSTLRTKNIINLNLRQADLLADEFSSLLLSLITIPIDRYNPDYNCKTYRLSLCNLMGGHAGDNINKVRKNSIKMILGFFRKLKSTVDLEMLALSGGDRYDHIPSFADLEFIINSDYENELLNAFEILKNEAIEKNLRYEPDMKLNLEEIESKYLRPISTESFNHLASFIELCPSGIFAVNSLDNQVISSSNLSTARTLKNSINMILVFRSLTEEGMRQMLEKGELAANIAKSILDEKLFIPSWKNKEEDLTKIFMESYEELFGTDLEVVKTQYSLDSSMVFKNLNVKIVSLGVKYKQDDKYLYTQIGDILRVIDLIENVLNKLNENKEKV